MEIPPPPDAITIIFDPHVQTAIGCLVLATIIAIGILFAMWIDKLSDDEKNGRN